MELVRSAWKSPPSIIMYLGYKDGRVLIAMHESACSAGSVGRQQVIKRHFWPLSSVPSRAHAICREMLCGRRKGWSVEDHGLSFL